MNILISAVGGQGALLASRILGTLAQKKSLEVKVSEVHGMSQRGGSVITHVRFGEKIYSPIVEKGSADVILAFEWLEGARYVDWLKTNGSLIINTQKIDPMPVLTNSVPYPEQLKEKLTKLPISFYSVDALAYAQKAGSIKTVNVVLIGTLAAITDIEKDIWYEAIKENVPAHLADINLKAFELGFSHTQLPN